MVEHWVIVVFDCPVLRNLRFISSSITQGLWFGHQATWFCRCGVIYDFAVFNHDFAVFDGVRCVFEGFACGPELCGYVNCLWVNVVYCDVCVYPTPRCPLSLSPSAFAWAARVIMADP